MIGAPIEPSLLVVLVIIAFCSGIGITTIGPGGIFVTAALYALTSLSSSEIAGTAHAMFLATGLVGSVAYIHSGEIRTGEGRVLAILLSGSSIVGAVTGSFANALVPRSVFGLLLGGVASSVGIVILYRERRGLEPYTRVDPSIRRGWVGLGILGFTLGVCSGLLGIGGPVLAVPALVVIGVPMLLAVAVAQVQSIFIAMFATAGYLVRGTISLPLAIFVGIPLLAGVVVGWRIAHLIDPARLKLALGVVLVAVGPILVY